MRRTTGVGGSGAFCGSPPALICTLVWKSQCLLLNLHGNSGNVAKDETVLSLDRAPLGQMVLPRVCRYLLTLC